MRNSQASAQTGGRFLQENNSFCRICRPKEGNDMLEGEELFVALQQWFKKGSPKTEWLMENGYITNSYEKTSKAEAYELEFVSKHRGSFIDAMKKAKNDSRKAFIMMGLKSYAAFEGIAIKLVKEGLVVEVGPREYKIKD